MGIYIPDMEMPKDCLSCPCMVSDCEGDMCAFQSYEKNATFEDWEQMKASCPLVPVPPHGRLIDADELRSTMYHEAFETDSQMQKWDSGCWIRYKMFEQQLDSAPTIIEAEVNKQ